MGNTGGGSRGEHGMALQDSFDLADMDDGACDRLECLYLQVTPYGVQLSLCASDVQWGDGSTAAGLCVCFAQRAAVAAERGQSDGTIVSKSLEVTNV